MNGFSEKVFLELSMPNDEDSVSDQKRIQSALRDRGFEHVTFPLHILRALYPMCRNADFSICRFVNDVLHIRERKKNMFR